MCSLALPSWASALSFQQVPLQQYPTYQATTLQSLDAKKPFYIKLWASWCQPCMQQMPHFQQLYQRFGDKINFVAVNIDINEQPAEIQKVVDKFKLTMPIWLDVDGKMALTLGLVGTPFSVLINSQGQQVFTSHESDQALDGFLTRLAQGQQLPPAPQEVVTAAAVQQALAPYQQGTHLLFISATWCDWYLKESRPAMAAACQKAQQNLNSLAAQLPNARWHGLVNHLWTDDEALQEFNQLYQMKVPFAIDHYGVVFQHFGVRNIPVLLKIVDGKVVKQITEFEKTDVVIQQLAD
jgi:thiol-disulfide isomerase/thioredoxin